MPAYDYDCAACGRRFEVIHGVHAESPTTCPLCGGGPVRKAITAAAIHYKGSGWAKKERRSTPTTAGAKATTDASGGDANGRDGGSGSDSTSDETAPSPAKKVEGASTGSAASDAGSAASGD